MASSSRRAQSVRDEFSLAGAAPAEPMFFVLCADGYVHSASPALRAYCGVPSERDERLHCTYFLHPRDIGMLRAHAERGQIDTFVRLRDEAGAYGAFRVNAIRLGMPERTEYWIGSCAPADARQPARSVGAGQRDISLQSVMSGNDCVELLGLDERVWAMSMNGAQMPEMTTGMAGKWSDFWSAADRPLAVAALDAARAGRVGRFEASVSTGTADAKATWWDIVITPILAADGRPESLLVISRDITPTKKLASQLRFLEASSHVLASALQIEEILRQIAELAVGSLVSWCVISWRDRARRASVACAGDNTRLARALEKLTPPTWRPKAVFIPTISAAALTELARDDEHFSRLQSLESRSLASVPLVSRGEVVGCLAVGTLERMLTRADVDLLEELGRLVAMAIENARLFEHERRVAKALQDALLPDRLPDVPGAFLATFYAAGTADFEIGGDWYDAFVLVDGRVVLSIGDVCGRGLRCAVSMGYIRQAIRSIARTTADPAAILDLVDAQLRLDAPETLATAGVIVYDPLTLRLTYALAGHPPPLVRLPDGTTLELGGTGMMLGLRGLDEPPTQSAQLVRGALLVMYTDGLTEATRDVVAGAATLRRVVASPRIADATNMAEFVHEQVMAGGTRLADDVAIVTLVVRELPTWEWHFNFVPGAADMQLARISLARALEAADVDDCGAAQMILGELLSNVLRYAPGPSDVRLECGDERVILHVLDRGAGFDPDSIQAPSPLGESMRGLIIVRALSHNLTIIPREGGGMHVAAALARRKKFV